LPASLNQKTVAGGGPGGFCRRGKIVNLSTHPRILLASLASVAQSKTPRKSKKLHERIII